MIKTLASLPGREGMISMILGMLQSPVRKFAYAISQVAEQKEA
jgi:large subunit ribosomal protein L10